MLGPDPLMFSDILETERLVVLNFWAADCPPCRVEMPEFQRVADAYSEDVLFVGLDVGAFTGLGSHAGAEQLLADLDIRYPTGYATDSSPIVDYEVRFMPTTVFISPGGHVEYRVDGQISERHLREVIESLR
jgi:thiol-disulfide isomerase/thioredoxin